MKKAPSKLLALLLAVLMVFSVAAPAMATGTPAGVGMGFDPPKFLSPGDVVECSIEKIGTLRNTVR